MSLPPMSPPPGAPLPPDVQRKLALLPPAMQQAFLSLPGPVQQLAASMPIGVLATFLQMPPAQQDAVIQRFLQATGGGGPGAPQGAPPPPVNGPPAGAPPGIPAMPPAPQALPAPAVPAGMPLPPMQGVPNGVGAGPLPGPGMALPYGAPAPVGPPQPSTEEKIARFQQRQAEAKAKSRQGPKVKGNTVTLPDGTEVKRPNPPKWQLKPIQALRKASPFGKKPPTWDECAEDVDTCIRRFAPRQRRITQDTQTFYLMEKGDTFSGTKAKPTAGDRIHTRSQAQRMIDRLASLVEASPDRVTIVVDPLAEDFETKQAAERMGDWLRYQRACDERAAMQPGRPLLPRTEAQVALLQGGLGFAFDVDDDGDVETPEYPLKYAVLPPSELFPLDHATYHIFTVKLHEARRRYPVINKQVPIRPRDDGSKDTRDEDQDVTVFAGSDKDGLWHWVGWKWGPQATEELRNRATPDKWIKKPTPVSMGVCVYQGPFYWGGSAQPALAETAAAHEAMVGYGIITPIRRTLEILDKVVSALATNVVKAIDPPLAIIAGEGQKAKDIKKPSTLPGATNYFEHGTVVTPMMFGIASQPDLQQFVNSVVAELQDAMPPVQAGLGPAESGVDRFQQAEQAGSLAVDPVTNFFQTFYEYAYSLRCELALRFSTQADIPKRQYFTAFPHFKTAGDSQGYYDELTPKDIERNGARPGQIRVRYDRLSQVEKQAQAERVKGLVEANLKSGWAAMRELGEQDPDRESKRIYEEKILHSDPMVHALGELTLYQLGSPEALEAYAKQSAAPPAPPPGMPPLPGMPPAGLPMPGPSPLPGIPSPNLPSALVQGPAAQAGLV